MKLTNEMRSSIVHRCLTATFAKSLEKHMASRTKLADEIYHREHNYAEKIAAKLPAEWQHTTGSFTIQHDGFSYRSSYRAADPNTACSEMKLSKRRLAPHTSTINIKVPKSDAFYKRADDIARAEVQLAKDREALKDKLTRMLAGISTDKQLMEVWPEGKKFFPDFTPPARGMVPTALIDSVNAIVQANA
jgi:hypothetical protein